MIRQLLCNRLNRALLVMHCVGVVGAFIPPAAIAKTQINPSMLNVRCNTDGSYDCGGHCEPRFCC